jgi:predicted PurR-regulated permease PerM
MTTTSSTFKNVIAFLLIVLSGLFVWYFFRIILYILISVVLSLIGQPLTNLLHKIRIYNMKIPMGICAFLVLVLMISLFLGFISVLFPLLVSQAEYVSSLDIARISGSLEVPLLKFETFLRSWSLLAPTETIGSKIISEIIAIATFDRFTIFFNSLINLTAEIFFGFLAISFITYFFLKEKNLFTSIMLYFTPAPHKQEALEIYTESKVLLRRYFVGLVTDLAAVFIMISFCMWLLGLPNALVIGFFAGLLNIIPYIGPIIATIIGIFLGVAAYPELDFYTQILPLILKIAASFIIVNTIDVGVLQPLIYSKSVKSHPLEIFIVFMMAGMVAGVFGMIVAIPTYSVVRIIFRQFILKSSWLQGIQAEFNHTNQPLDQA